MRECTCVQWCTSGGGGGAASAPWRRREQKVIASENKINAKQETWSRYRSSVSRLNLGIHVTQNVWINVTIIITSAKFNEKKSTAGHRVPAATLLLQRIHRGHYRARTRLKLHPEFDFQIFQLADSAQRQLTWLHWEHIFSSKHTLYYTISTLMSNCTQKKNVPFFVVPIRLL